MVVNRRICTVPLGTNPISSGRLAEGIGSDSSRVGSCVSHFMGIDQGVPVADTLARLLSIREATNVAGSAYQSNGDSVTIFVDDDAIVKITSTMGEVRVHRYICIRGLEPSGRVNMLALFNPPPS